MTVQSKLTVQHGVEITVPLNRLKRSPDNARRRGHRPEDVEALAASIAAKGVLQPPVVAVEHGADGEPTGSYRVTIGEGRRLALKLLAKRKRIARDAPVRCVLDEANDAFEISLDENVTRFAMHPADQFEAFRDLSERQGRSAAEIALRFGVSERVVQQRLRLGALSPVLMTAFRAGDLSLEQVMAFAVSTDHDRQEQVYRDLSYNRSPSLIRRLMTEHEVEAGDRRARFIGVEAYEAAGGVVRQDLFSEGGEGWFEDVALLDRLVAERLAAEAEAVRAAEGWKWAEVSLDGLCGPGLGRLYPHRPALGPEEEARLQALAAEYDRLVDVEGDDHAQRLAEIDAELQAATAPVYALEDRSRAGVIVTLTYDGAVRVERGYIRAEDQPKAEADPDAPVAGPGGPKPLSESLRADLSAHRTLGLRCMLGEQPQAALLAVLHRFVLQAFYPGVRGSCLLIDARPASLGGSDASVADCEAARLIEALHALWAGRLPPEPEALWSVLADLGDDDRLALLAHCAGLTVQAMVTERTPAELDHADALAVFCGLDMRRFWQATPETYFGRVSKDRILEAVREAKGEASVGPLTGLKKDAMAKAAADLLGPDGWLPPLLRSAAATSA